MTTYFAIEYKKQTIVVILFMVTAFFGAGFIYLSGKSKNPIKLEKIKFRPLNLLLGGQFSSVLLFGDICSQLIDLKNMGNLDREGGLSTYIGCLKPAYKNNMTAQAMKVILAEQSLLKLINNEIRVKFNTPKAHSL